MNALIALFATFLLVPALSQANETARLESDVRYLQAELELAKKNAIYSEFDLAQAKIRIKAAGLTLREFPILAIDMWGSGISPGSYVMTERRTSDEPQRARIEPGKAGETASPEIDALERDDMPTRYTLVYEGDVFIRISETAPDLGSRLMNMPHDVWESLSQPLVMLWNRMSGQDHTLIELELDPVDSQALYWSLSVKSTSLLLPPRD